MKEFVQGMRRLTRNLCLGEPLYQKGGLQAVFLRLWQMGTIQ